VRPLPVLGIGSPFGGDLAGWAALERLQQLIDEAGDDLSDQVQLTRLRHPGTELIERLRGHPHAVLVDAIADGGTPGIIHRLEPAALIRTAKGLSTHDLGVAETLAMAEALGLMPSRLAIFGLTVTPGKATSSGKIDELAREVFAYLQTEKSAAERRKRDRCDAR